MYVTDPEAKQPGLPADPEPKPEKRPEVNYENPKPCEPIRPSPMFKRLAY
jgi:hypothetical protein